MNKRILENGVYDTCPTYGPQVYMPMRQVIVKDGAVEFVDKEHSRHVFNVGHFFDVNNVFNCDTKESFVVTYNNETNQYQY